MSAGAELSQSLAADAATYTLTIEGRAAGGQTPEVIASYMTSKKPAAVGAAKRSGLSAADSTASLVAAGYIGTNNIDVANSIHVALSARFSAANQSCVAFLALYDASDGLIGITDDFTFQGDGTFTDGTLYVSPSRIVDVHAASQVFLVLRTPPSSGTVSLYLEAL